MTMRKTQTVRNTGVWRKKERYEEPCRELEDGEKRQGAAQRVREGKR